MKNTKPLNKAIIIISKIVEVCCWIASAFMLAATIFVAAGKPWLLSLISDIDISNISEHADLNAFGLSLDVSGHIDMSVLLTALLMFFIATLIVCVCMALVFRNTNLIFKTAEGLTKFAEGRTPFQKSVVRMMRQIGILLIAGPIIQIIVSGIGSAMTHGLINMNVNVVEILIGLVVIALAQYFQYGMELQNDVDGLL